MTLIAAGTLAGAAFGQVTFGAPVSLRACDDAHRTGRRISSHLDTVALYIPYFAHMTKVQDADYVNYFVRYGPERDKLWLTFLFSMGTPSAPPALQNPEIGWTAQKLFCNRLEYGKDWRGSADDGRRRRYVALPFEYATYEGVPPRAAKYFDKISGTMCCGKCSYCRK